MKFNAIIKILTKEELDDYEYYSSEAENEQMFKNACYEKFGRNILIRMKYE